MKRKDIIILSIVLLFSVFLIVLVQSFTNPIYVNKIEEKQMKSINLVFPEATSYQLLDIDENIGSLSLRAHVFKDELPHGYIYEVNGINNFGSLKLLVGVDLNNQIFKIEELVLNQSLNYMDRVNAGISHYLNSNIDEVIDASLGSTASVSITTINEMMRQVKLAHLEFEGLSSWKDDVFTNYEVLEVLDSTNNSIESIEVISDNQGYVYNNVAATGLYNNFSPDKLTISIDIAIDENGILLGYQFNIYEHTLGFQADVINYLNTFIGTSLLEVADTYIQPSEGSNYSKTLVHSILVIMKEALL